MSTQTKNTGQHSDVCVHAVNNGEIIPTNAFGQRNVRSLQPQPHKMLMHSGLASFPILSCRPFCDLLNRHKRCSSVDLMTLEWNN